MTIKVLGNPYLINVKIVLMECTFSQELFVLGGCTVILFRPILQGIVRLRMCEKCWQSVVEPHLAGKLSNQGVNARNIAAT